MKARPVRLIPGEGYTSCAVEDATHVTLMFPGPSGERTLPVILRGSRDDHPGCVWTWDGDTESPTLRPSVRTRGCDWEQERPFVCHTWVNNGKAVFLEDSTHALRGQTLDLLDV